MSCKIFSLKVISLIVLLSMEMLMQSCKKFVDIKSSTNLIQTDELFGSDAAALSAVNGVYIQMRILSPSLANGSLSIYAGLSSDELATASNILEYDAFNKNAILSNSNVVLYQMWSASYKVIYSANSIIEHLQNSTQLSEATQEQLLGEMKVVRSLYYFYLVNLFGDVPLVTSSDYTINEHLARTPVKNIYEQIIKDLQDAENLLGSEYPSENKARPNKWTAAALLAKTYLYTNDWSHAEIEASKIINSGDYSLEEDLNSVFKIFSNETIWQIAPANESRNTIEGGFFIPYSSAIVPSIFVTNSLLNSFEDGDFRKTNWLGFNSISGIQYYYPFKYKIRGLTPVEEYDIVFRLGELYLIRAEARAKQNKLNDALTDLNKIRNRANLPNISISNQSALIAAILKERRTELFAEWGNRWFDLKRTGLINSVMPLTKGDNWQQTDALYPIPFSEIQINTALTQNPGY